MIAKKLASAPALWGPPPIAKVHLFFSGQMSQKIGERSRVVGADPYCESGLKAIFFRASGAKQSFSSWWEHLNLHVISCVETLLGRNLYENFLCASGAIRYLRTHRISMST